MFALLEAAELATGSNPRASTTSAHARQADRKDTMVWGLDADGPRPEHDRRLRHRVAADGVVAGQHLASVGFQPGQLRGS